MITITTILFPIFTAFKFNSTHYFKKMAGNSKKCNSVLVAETVLSEIFRAVERMTTIPSNICTFAQKKPNALITKILTPFSASLRARRCCAKESYTKQKALTEGIEFRKFIQPDILPFIPSF